MSKKNESWLDIIGKGTTSYIKAKTKQKQIQNEMKSKLLIKRIEQEMDPMYQIQKSMARQYRAQPGQYQMSGSSLKRLSPKELYTRDIIRRKRAGEDISPEEEKFIGMYIKPENRTDDIYRGTAAWKQQDASKTLLNAYLNELEGEVSGSDKWWDLGKSQADVIRRYKEGRPLDVTPDKKIDVGKTLGRLGKNMTTFFQWAKAKHPELARQAFPGRMAMSQNLPSFDSEEEVYAANLPDGQQFYLNGILKRWRLSAE